MSNKRLNVSAVNSDYESSTPTFLSRADAGPTREEIVSPDTYLLKHEGSGAKEGNSLRVIFSLWSTMIGSTLLAMPRVVRDAGIVSAVVGTAIVCVSNTYTVQLMEKLGRFHDNNGTAILVDAGRKVYLFATVVSVIVLLGANTIYMIYICDGLMTLADIPTTNTKYRPIFSVGIAAAFFLVGLLKSLKPLFYAAGYAIVIVVFIVAFIIAKASQQLVHGNACDEVMEEPAEMVWTGFGPFVQNCATMAVSLYIHSLVLPIISLATRPRNNPRDLVVAFIATAVSVVGPAALCAYAFRYCKDVNGDFLEMFHDPETTVARVAIILLVGIVFPILLYNARNQLLGIITGREDYPYWAHVVFNVLAIAVSTVPCAMNVATTVVAAAVGICAVFWVSFLPVGLWWYHVKRRERERLSVGFYVVNGAVIAFGCVLVVSTILAESTTFLN